MTLKIKKLKILVSLLFSSLIIIPNIGYTELGNPPKTNPYNYKPSWLVIHSTNYYDGDNDDLVTAGIGFTPLSSKIQNFNYVDPTNPTTQELRRAKLNRFIDRKSVV